MVKCTLHAGRNFSKRIIELMHARQIACTVCLQCQKDMYITDCENAVYRANILVAAVTYQTELRHSLHGCFYSYNMLVSIL